MSRKRIMGIDIGFRSSGWVLAEIRDERPCPTACGCVITEKNARKQKIRVADDDVDRCQVVFRELAQAIAEYKPDALAIELPSGGAQGARANRCMGMATAIAAGVTEYGRLAVEWVTPNEVKLATVGKRNASKDAIMYYIRQKYPDMAWPKTKKEFEHVADAMGVLRAVQNGTIFRMLCNW